MMQEVADIERCHFASVDAGDWEEKSHAYIYLASEIQASQIHTTVCELAPALGIDADTDAKEAE